MKTSGLLTIFLLLTLLILVGCKKIVKESDLFFPRRDVLRNAPASCELIEIRTKDQADLRGFHLIRRANLPELIYFYGNGETVASSWGRILWLSEKLNVNVAAVDYRGYGASGSNPSLKNCAEDTLAVYDWLNKPDVKKKVIVYGRSIGAAMAVYLAAHRSLQGLILEAPPSSISDVVRSWNKNVAWYLRLFVRLAPEKSLEKNEDQPIQLIPNVTSPLLIIHGEQDRTVPLPLGKKLFESAGSKNKKWISIPNAGHNDLSLESIEPSLVEWVQKLW